MAVDVLGDRRVDAPRRAPRGPVLIAGVALGATPPADLDAELDGLAGLAVNFDDAETPESGDDPRWHVDHGRALVGREAPGPPEPGGPWERACVVLRDYQFTAPGRLRGIFRPGDPLLGRNMLLEGRFGPMRFHLGVRVTGVEDAERDGQRVWGWTYETLQGHLEEGRLTYEVVKDLASGDVEFVIRAFSRRAPVPNPILRLGFAVFGRAVQEEFYHHAGQRVRELAGVPGRVPVVETGPDGVTVAPAGSGPSWTDRLAVLVRYPGASRGL
ncbi:DUF1990 family protein [Pseudonocardia phyllosphaerae]|uniref:DUF1990 family protein n=1 Tax=Pseudonocardia phyllosphaerae TaxID=3390502 RepID=UPI00397AB3D6